MLHEVLSRVPTVVFIFTVFGGVAAAVNMQTCGSDIRRGVYGLTIGLDAHGQPVADVSEAKGVNYTTCLRTCGSGTQAFDWPTFAQQFSAWFVPWLALLSQLPFGAEDHVDNLVSILLTVGSPALAAYTLSIALLNRRWLEGCLKEVRYPNRRQFVDVFTALQHIPIRVVLDGPLLPSLVVLPENDLWWSEMAERTQQSRNWDIPAAVNIGWVLVAFLFTIIYSFNDFGSFVSSHGHAVASVWMWLLPLVVGWLRVGTQTESKQLRRALLHSNTMAYVATELTPIKAGNVSEHRAVDYGSPKASRVRRDEERAAPIFNYARVFSWSQAAEHVVRLYWTASLMAERHLTVDGGKWVPSGIANDSVHEDNRRGNVDQVVDYVNSDKEQKDGIQSVFDPVGSRWAPGVLRRISIAVVLALALQWCTSGAALFITVLTPTIGLGCRSMAYLTYASAATLVLFLHVFSSIFSHASGPSYKSHPSKTMRGLAVALRWAGKTVAIINGLCIIAACTFQFTNVYSNCFCMSSVIGLGKDNAYILFLTGSDLINLGTRSVWVGGIALASGSALLYGLFVYLASSNTSL